MVVYSTYSQQHKLSDYEYIIYKNFIAIKDLDKGRKSVTNNIHSIIAHICEKHCLDVTKYLVVYKDSEGRIDAYDFLKRIFFPIKSHQLKKINQISF